MIPSAFTLKASLSTSIEESSTPTLSVTLEPKLTSPPPVNADPAVIVTESFSNWVLVIVPVRLVVAKLP